MNARRPVVLLALLLCCACGKRSDRAALLQPIKRASLRPAPIAPFMEWRPNMRTAYRLRPDSRFLLAFGELDRLAGTLPAPPAAPAAAEFVDGQWTVRIGLQTVGKLPELPDFSDALEVLVARAGATLSKASHASASQSEVRGRDFLMPALAQAMPAAEKQAIDDHSYAAAARLFADLAFQTPDRLQLAPIIPARALALLAAARAADPTALVEEEVLLADAMGYTRHAQERAAKLPADSPARAYATRNDAALRQIAASPDASEEARFLAVKRSTAAGQIDLWRQARKSYLGEDAAESVAAAGTIVELDVPRQIEVDGETEYLWRQLPEIVTRELVALPAEEKPALIEGITQFDTNLKRAEQAAKGPLWDAAVLRGFYEAAFFAPAEIEDRRWLEQVNGPTASRLDGLLRSYEQRGVPPDPSGDTRGAAVIFQEESNRGSRRPKPNDYSELRALVGWLDSRPDGRYILANLSRLQLEDQRAGEDLLRSFLSVVGDGDRKRRVDAAIYLADWPTVRQIFDAPDLTAPEATRILWEWFTSQADPDALEAQIDRTIERFPKEWNPVNYSIDALRKAKKYDKACAIVERWLARNPDPNTTGWFHAHIRLAHNYVLAGQYDKCRRTAEAIHDVGADTGAWRDRALAGCLFGLGQRAEAERLLRKAANKVPESSETLRQLIQLLWAQGKVDEAAELLLNRQRVLQGWEVCVSLQEDLFSALDGRPAAELDHAIDAIAKHPELARQASCAYQGFGEAGRWEQAVHIAERLNATSADQTNSLSSLYGYVKAAKGRAAAAEWLRTKMPIEKRNGIAVKALSTHEDDLLWDFIGTPYPSDHVDLVWLFRAVSFVLRGSEWGTDSDTRRDELMRYYSQPLAGDNHVLGRYLLGLAPEKEVIALATTAMEVSPVAYTLGVHAQQENRLRDATDWYRVAVESPKLHILGNLSQFQLADWTAMRQGISVIQGKAGQSRGAGGK
jgi:hypothetical protein